MVIAQETYNVAKVQNVSAYVLNEYADANLKWLLICRYVDGHNKNAEKMRILQTIIKINLRVVKFKTYEICRTGYVEWDDIK